MSIASDKKVADITLGELKELIREVILETLDPDCNPGIEIDVFPVCHMGYVRILGRDLGIIRYDADRLGCKAVMVRDLVQLWFVLGAEWRGAEQQIADDRRPQQNCDQPPRPSLGQSP